MIDLLTIPGVTIMRGAIMLACIVVGASLSFMTSDIFLAVLVICPLPWSLIIVGTYEEIKGRRVLPF